MAHPGDHRRGGRARAARVYAPYSLLKLPHICREERKRIDPIPINPIRDEPLASDNEYYVLNPPPELEFGPTLAPVTISRLPCPYIVTLRHNQPKHITGSILKSLAI